MGRADGFHSFNSKLDQGQEAERQLDAHFSDRYIIETASMDEQRRGIDRWFSPRAIGAITQWGVEYKADFIAGKTGNAFIETVGGDRIGLPGWAYTTKADIICYWVIGTGNVYIIKPASIVEKLDEWFGSRPVKTSKNKTYRGYGLLVPLKDLADIAERTEVLQWVGVTNKVG